jgi:Zn-dependent protease with chaperone function
MPARPGRDFFAAQRRHRRATWRLSAVSAVSVALMGLPLSVVVSPLILAVAFVVNDLIDLATPTPDLLGELAHRLHLTSNGPPQQFTPSQIALIVALLLIPGIVMMVITWGGLRRLFHHVGAGLVVLDLGARPPKDGDFEEHQLANIVEEMALAAGIPPPKAMILDSGTVNAVAVGRSIEDAVIVLPRRVLQDEGRAPTEAIVGELVSTIVNGDLKIALTLASVFETFDLVQTALSAPFSKQGRQIIWRLVRLCFRANPHDAHVVLDQLVSQAGPPDPDDDEGRLSKLTSVLKLPFMGAVLAFYLVYAIVGAALVRPVMGRLWRHRRLLADATTVQLTRDPDALYEVLGYLEHHKGDIPAGSWGHLFIVGDGRGSTTAPLSSFQPKMEKRLQNLVTLGAHPRTSPVHDEKAVRKAARKARWEEASGRGKALAIVATLVGVPLLAALLLIAAYMLLLAMGLAMLVSFAIDLLFLAPWVLIVHALVRH